MDSEFIELTRGQLYDEIWKEPATKVAARYGISGNALAKICRKLDVPVPSRGYWALRAVGQASERPPLPPARVGAPQVHRLAKRAAEVPAAGTKPDRLLIRVADELESPHPLVKAAASGLRSPGNRAAENSHRTATTYLDIAVSAGALDRALRIMDALLKAAEARGHTIAVSPPSAPDAWGRRIEKRGKTFVVIGEEKVTVRLEESYDRTVGREPRPSGRFVLSTDTYGGDGERKTWRDSQSRRLEHYLGDFVETAERIAAFGQARTLETHRREDEAARQRHWNSLLTELHQRADRWAAASGLEAYLDAVALASAAAEDPQSETSALLAWAREQAQLNQQEALDVSRLRLDPPTRPTRRFW